LSAIMLAVQEGRDWRRWSSHLVAIGWMMWKFRRISVCACCSGKGFRQSLPCPVIFMLSTKWKDRCTEHSDHMWQHAEERWWCDHHTFVTIVWVGVVVRVLPYHQECDFSSNSVEVYNYNTSRSERWAESHHI
jgi:hypothetical protein